MDELEIVRNPSWVSDAVVPRASSSFIALRDRRALRCDSGTTVFGTGADGFELLLTSNVKRALRAATDAAQPREAIGLLLGRVLRDTEGPYTVVDAMVVGSAAAAKEGSVLLSGDQMSMLKAEAELRQPALDLVGWWHSHRAMSPYSAVDLDEQRTWSDRNHVGVLTFGRGTPWARAYRGPGSEALYDRSEDDSSTTAAKAVPRERVPGWWWL